MSDCNLRHSPVWRGGVGEDIWLHAVVRNGDVLERRDRSGPRPPLHCTTEWGQRGCVAHSFLGTRPGMMDIT